MKSSANTRPPASAAPSPTGDEQAQTLDTVTVKGIRGSLEASRDIKRDSAQIVDAIVAEDIGKLPDNSVAAALQRVTGVQINPYGGINFAMAGKH